MLRAVIECHSVQWPKANLNPDPNHNRTVIDHSVQLSKVMVMVMVMVMIMVMVMVMIMVTVTVP